MNAVVLQLPSRSIFILKVQTSTELNTQHTYLLNASDDLPSGLITQAVDHKIHHNYPKLLNIPLLNTEYDTIHVPRKTVIGTLHLMEMEDIEVKMFCRPKKIPTQQILQQNS